MRLVKSKASSPTTWASQMFCHLFIIVISILKWTHWPWLWDLWLYIDKILALCIHISFMNRFVYFFLQLSVVIPRTWGLESLNAFCLFYNRFLNEEIFLPITAQYTIISAFDVWHGNNNRKKMKKINRHPFTKTWHRPTQPRTTTTTNIYAMPIFIRKSRREITNRAWCSIIRWSPYAKRWIHIPIGVHGTWTFS